MRRIHKTLLILAVLATAWGCTMPLRAPARGIAPRPEPTTEGLVVKLAEGSPAETTAAPVPRAPATPLSAAETEAVLKRLPPLKTPPEKPFALREKSLPPPRTGETVKHPFPPPEQPEPHPAVAHGPLQVLRHAPEGDVPLAPQLTVTFSQPMVAVTSQAELAAGHVPVKLDPQPPGEWQWLGTQTLLFAPKVRFPMATRYAVEIPAGTKSAVGGTLAEAVRWSFTTPPPQVKSFEPTDGPTTREPLMIATFDQAVDPAAVLKTVHVSAGGRAFDLRLATSEEIAANDETKALSETKGVEKKRWMAFKATAPLPADQAVTVDVGPGTPSTEGPLTSQKAATFSFRTYGPLRVESQWPTDETSPFYPFNIRFTNPLDEKAFRPAQVHVVPTIPDMKVVAQGSSLSIAGETKGRTTYTVTLDPALRDVFGQTLGASAPLHFKVGPAEKSLQSAGGSLVVLDPEGAPDFTVYSVNHPTLRVRVWAVSPSDWPAYMTWTQNRNDEHPPQPPGRSVEDKVLRVGGHPDEMVESRVDLAPFLTDKVGQLVVDVEQTERPANRWDRQEVTAWVQVTRIGLDAFVDSQALHGWATSLADGAPLPGVSLQLAGDGAPRETDAHGLATIPLPAEAKGPSVLVARRGDDVAMLPENTYWWGGAGGWRRQPQTDSLAWYVFDDRHMYRPGETVHIKGWIRRLGAGPTGDVSAVDGAASGVSYVLSDAVGNAVAKGERRLNALGGFDFTLDLPPTMNLGNASLSLTATGASGLNDAQHYYQFQVQEFRRPEFEVTAESSEGPHLVGGSANATVAASYYAGGGLPNADVSWRVTTTSASYSPPGWSDYTFGTWVPWWDFRPFSQRSSHVETFAGKTDATGKHHLHLDFVSVSPPRPTTVTAQATVMDVNRQAWTASTTMLVHPAARYVGLKTDRTFVQQGEPIHVDFVVTDIDGKLQVGVPVTLRAVRKDWTYENGEYRDVDADVQEVTLASKDGPERATFQAKHGGRWEVTATVEDARQRPNQSQLTMWVAGGASPPERNVKQEKATLIPDRKDYRPGDTAEILVQAPFSPASGVLTLRRGGVVETRAFAMSGPSYTLKIPVKSEYMPNVHVQVDLVGAAPRAEDSPPAGWGIPPSSDRQPFGTDSGQAEPKLPKRPAYASGELNLSVPPLSRTLTVEATPRVKAIEPGGETTVDVTVKDAAGKPVAGSEVALVVVDESVLALTGYRLPDPLDVFYPTRPDGVQDFHAREYVLLGKPEPRAAAAGGADNNTAIRPMMARKARGTFGAMAAPAPPGEAHFVGGSGAAAPQPIATRANFNALATFQAALPTDASGHAAVAVKLPDSLTRYRVMAVAVADGKQFGQAESTLTARLPLMVRPSPPRFLNFGDRFFLPVVLQNQTDSPMPVHVAARAANLELGTGAAEGYAVTVPANDRVEVLFPAAAHEAGTARFQVGAASGKWADAAELSLPVWTPATTEAFATYGTIDHGAIVQPVAAPPHVFPQFGGLEVTTSSTALQSLTDALLYLQAYPFECSEQISSRILAVAALRDVLTAFHAPGLPPAKEMVSAVHRDVERLKGMQNPDGGFGFWQRGGTEWPYLGIHVANALIRAKQKGFEVPAKMLQRSLSYLRDIESHIPNWYDDDCRRTLIAYALNVRQRMGDADPARARRLIREAGLDKLPLEAVGWILPVLDHDRGSQAEVKAIRALLANRATETAATAHFVTSYGDQDYVMLHSSRRVDGVILDALIDDQPKSDLIPKLVAGLLDHRTRGRWENTQENAFVLLALDHYFNTYEKVTPDFVARVWLGDGYAGEQAFRGRSIDRQEIDIPMDRLASGEQNLVIDKQGQGRLYYRIGMQYAPTSLHLQPLERGFTVIRTYQAVDHPGDVRRDADGVWHVKAGAQVRVRLKLVATSRRYHVALVDPLPAGLEAENPALAVTGSIPQDPNEQKAMGPWWWWFRPWFDHQNLRDERVEAFAALLWDGVYDYSYVARATTPGTFVVPPPKAEEMYHPETFGRGASDRMVVE